ncbi:hypothetical protein FQN49_001266 [Arthroderma sp. PD_2]|nr:hypothetical protein FQN49_001266 [Arthroderma sp. PD_2]
MPPKRCINWNPLIKRNLEIRAKGASQTPLPSARHCTVAYPARLRESGTYAAAYFYLVTPTDPGPWYVVDSVLWDTVKKSKLYEAAFMLPHRDPPTSHKFHAEWNEGLGVFVVRPEEKKSAKEKPSCPRRMALMMSYDGSSDEPEEPWGPTTADEAHSVGDEFDIRCLPPLPDNYLEDASQYEPGESSASEKETLADTASPCSLDLLDMSSLYTALDKQSDPPAIQTLLLESAPDNETETNTAEPDNPTSISVEGDVLAWTAEVDTVDAQALPECPDASQPTDRAADEASQEPVDMPIVTDEYEDPATEDADLVFLESTQDATQDEDDGTDDDYDSGPSDKEISEEAQREIDYREYISEVCPQIHHFNYFGEAIVYPSSTPPEISLFALMCGPKTWVDEVSPRATIIRRAIKFIDPVLYTGPRRDLNLHSGLSLIKAITGHVHQFYTEHGAWIHDETKWVQEQPIVDPTDSDAYYSEPWLPINGWLKVHWRIPMRFEYLTGLGNSTICKPQRKVRAACASKSPLSQCMLASEY